MELPFAQVVKIQNLQNGMNTEINMNINNIEYSKVDSSQMQIKIETKIFVQADKNERINGIKNIEVSEDKLPEMPSIVIYYVKPGDSLWKIAKKYRTTVYEIMSYNDLKDDKIYPNQQLIIPKRNAKVAAELL
mgnify:FL=1